MEKLEKTDQQVEEVRAKQAWELRIKTEQLRRKDEQGEVVRLQRMEQYKREKTLEKIKKDDAKTQRVFAERAKLIEGRLELRRQLDHKKEQMAKKFENSRRRVKSVENSYRVQESNQYSFKTSVI
jgi:hypothetical protein